MYHIHVIDRDDTYNNHTVVLYFVTKSFFLHFPPSIRVILLVLGRRMVKLVIGDIEASAVGRSAMRWSCLQFNVLLLPESYQRLAAGLLVSCCGKAHPCQRRNWSIRREEPSIAITADLRPFVNLTGLTVKTALFLFVIVTHSSSMKGPRHNFHAERELAHPKTTSFHYFSNYSTPTFVVVLLVVNQRSKLHT